MDKRIRKTKRIRGIEKHIFQGSSVMDQTISDVYSELSGVVNSTYAKVADRILIKTAHGIVVYNKYVIRKTAGGIQVICRTGTRDLDFGSAKNALIWAILDHNNLVYESKRVLELDCFLASAQVDAEIHRRGKTKGNIERHLIQHSKLQCALDKQKQFLYELDGYKNKVSSLMERDNKCIK